MNRTPKGPAKKVRLIAKDPAQEPGRLKCIGGSSSDDWNNRIANDTLQTLWRKDSDDETRDRQFGATIAGLIGISPKDELEGMMAAQLIASHSAAMECYRRAMLSEQTFEGGRENLNQANKLSRTFTVLLDALNRHRGKGAQRVTVEHVHIHSGAQAVVGVVETPGGGDRQKAEDQPHAKQIAHAPEPALPSPDAEGRLVPIASDAEWPVPHARRKVAGSTEGQ